jgi:predicted nicotinamide N-methyase
MNYPIKLIEVEQGFSLYLPNEFLVKSTYDQLNKVAPNTPFPFWAKIWPSSIALSNFLHEHTHWVKDKTVLELGAGIGLPSFQIAKMVKAVIISDHNSDAVELIEKNIALLDLKNAKAVLLDWNKFQNDIKAEVILLSDVNYAPVEFDSLLQIIENYLSKGSTIIIATPQRIMGIPFIEKLQPYFKRETIYTETENMKEVAICIYVLYK